MIDEEQPQDVPGYFVGQKWADCKRMLYFSIVVVGVRSSHGGRCRLAMMGLFIYSAFLPQMFPRLPMITKPKGEAEATAAGYFPVNVPALSLEYRPDSFAGQSLLSRAPKMKVQR